MDVQNYENSYNELSHICNQANYKRSISEFKEKASKDVKTLKEEKKKTTRWSNDSMLYINEIRRKNRTNFTITIGIYVG